MRGDGYNQSDVVDPTASAAVTKMQSDPEFTARYFSDDKYVRDFAVDQLSNAMQNAAARSYHAPSEENAKVAGDKIKAVMGDKLFQERYQSNDPRIRGAAIDGLSKLFFEAHGNRPNSDEPVENASPQAPANPNTTPQTTRLIPLITGPVKAAVNDPYANMSAAEVYRNYGTAGLGAFNTRR